MTLRNFLLACGPCLAEIIVALLARHLLWMLGFALAGLAAWTVAVVVAELFRRRTAA